MDERDEVKAVGRDEIVNLHGLTLCLVCHLSLLYSESCFILYIFISITYVDMAMWRVL